MTATRNRRGPALRLLCLGIAQCLYAVPALAQNLPATMTVNTNVSAPVTNGNTMTVNVTGPRAYAEWNTFDIANGFTFQVTNSGPNNYIFVNRVTGGTQSDIFGNVIANGNFWLLNPAGIVVGNGGVFDVGGLLLSTATTLNGETEATNGAAFLAGATNTFSFGGAANGVIVQPGALLTADIGAIAVIASSVNFGGTANAGAGETALVGAQGVTISFDADLNAVSTLTIDNGTNSTNGVSVNGNAQFSAAKTIIAASGMTDGRGNVLLHDDNAANNITFQNGDVVLYAGPNVTTGFSRTLISNGVVQQPYPTSTGAARIQASGFISAPGNLHVTGAGGIGYGTMDLSLQAGGDLTMVGSVRGRDVALSGARVNVTGISARDDVVIRSNGDVILGGTISTGQTLDGQAATDVVGTADLLAGATLAGNDADVSAGTGLASFGARPIITGDYRISAGDFMGSEVLNPNFGAGTTNAFSITDTAGGFTLGFNIVNPGDFSFTTLGGGGLTTFATITSTNGNVSLNGGGGLAINQAVTSNTGNVALTSGGNLSLAGNITSGAGGAVNLNAAGLISQGGGVINTPMLDANAASGIFLTGLNTVGAMSLTNTGGNGIEARSETANTQISRATTGSGNVRLTGTNGLRLSNSTISTGTGQVSIFGNTTISGSNTVSGLGAGGMVWFRDAINGATAGEGDLVVTAGSTGAQFGGDVGATTALNSLSVSGTTRLFGGGVRTDSGITLGSTIVDASAPASFFLDAGAGTLSIQAIGASNLGLNASGASVDIGTVSGNDANVSLTATNGNLTLGSVDAGGTASLSTTGGSVIVTGFARSAGALTVNSANHARIASATSNGGDVSVTAIGEVTGANGTDRANLSAAGNVSVDAGALARLGTVNAGNGITVVADNVDITAANAGGILSLIADAGNLSLGSGSGNSVALNTTGVLAVTGALTTPFLTGTAGGGATLGGANQITEIGNFTSDGLVLNNARALLVSGNVDAGAGNATIAVTGGNLAIGATGQVAGNDVVLSTTANFVNNSGADAVDAAGRWVVYSAAPGGNTFGGLDSGNTAIWNGTLATVAPGSTSGNRYVFAFQPTLTFTTTSTSKVYGTDLTATGGNLFTVSGLQSGVAGAFLGDTAGTAYSGTPLLTSAGFGERASVAGGPYAIGIANGSLAGLNGYAIALNGSGQVTVTPRAITGTGTPGSKTYDGTTNATGNIVLSGVLSGDTVGANGNFAFVDANAGTGKTVTLTGATLTGADAGNYTLTISGTALADILRLAITGTGNVDDKTYDGTNAATGSITLNGVIAGDDVGATGSFSFTDRNAGTGKVVTISGATLTGADAGNYTLTISGTALADILRRSITGTANVDDKTYDGTTNATGTIVLNGVIAGDNVGATGSFNFADRNAGTGKTVTIGGATLTGADAGNYTLTISGTALADILRRSITGTANVDDKTYDGTTNATGTIALNGVVAGDSVGATAGFSFADRNAGTGKTVTVGGATLTGADAGNYTLTISGTALADILRKSITGTGNVDDKTYDGTTTATGTIALTGVVAGDNVGANGSFSFADKNAGTGKVVTISGATLTGADAGNYTLAISGTALADILRKSITGTGTAVDKTYDGTTATTGTISLDGVVAGDNVGATGSFHFADRNAGTGKTVTISGVSLTGADAGNYTVTVPGSAVADILRRAITVTANPASKFEGETDPAFGYQVTTGSLVAGDSLAGALTRAPGEAPGAYAIGQGTLNASSNYQLTFVGSTLTITEVPVNPVPAIAATDDMRGLVGFLDRIGDRSPAAPLQVADERACATGSNGRDAASACKQSRTQ